MLTTLLLSLSLAAAPDAGPPPDPDLLATARALQRSYALDVGAESRLRSEPALIYSAARCEAQQRLEDTAALLERRPTSHALILAAATARAELDQAERLLVGYSPLACGRADVAQVIDCLDAVPEMWCLVNTTVAERVRAVELSRTPERDGGAL
jgi:hypothetical protein